MKDKEEVKAYDYENMEEWDRFIEKVDEVSSILRKLPNAVPSVLYQAYKYDARKSHERGLYSPSVHDELKKLESRGFVLWDDGWEPNEVHPQVRQPKNAIWEMKKFLNDSITEELEERFNEEYEGIIFDLVYSDFWEKVLRVTIYHSGE